MNRRFISLLCAFSMIISVLFPISVSAEQKEIKLLFCGSGDNAYVQAEGTGTQGKIEGNNASMKNYQSDVTDWDSNYAEIHSDAWDDETNGIKINITSFVQGLSGKDISASVFTDYMENKEAKLFFKVGNNETQIAAGNTGNSGNPAEITGTARLNFGADDTVYLCITCKHNYHQYKKLKLSYDDSGEAAPPVDSTTPTVTTNPGGSTEGKSFTLKYADGENAGTSKTVTVKPNTWTQITTDSFNTAAALSDYPQVQIISDDKVDFYLDNVSMKTTVGAEEAVNNGDMEGVNDGDNIPYWWNKEGAVTIASSNAQGKEGKSLYASGIGDDGIVVQYLKDTETEGAEHLVKAAAEYTVTAWVYYSDGAAPPTVTTAPGETTEPGETTAPGDNNFKLAYDDGGDVHTANEVNVEPNKWTQITLDVTTGDTFNDGENTYSKISVISLKNASFYLDDVTMISDAGEEAVNNGGMEGGVDQSTGIQNWWGKEGNATFAESETARTGEKSMYVSGLSGGSSGAMQYLQIENTYNPEHLVKPGTKYTLTAWVYYSDGEEPPVEPTYTFELLNAAKAENKATATVKNISDASQSGTVIFAAYKDGALVSVKTTSVQDLAANADMPVTFDIPSDSDGCRLFMWDSYSGMKPLAKDVTI